jgi:TRAP-type C4-dicarboxylate transport system substrate-binding protein
MLDMINNKMHASLTDEEREYIDKVLAEAKMNYLEVEKNEDNQESLEKDNQDETEA